MRGVMGVLHASGGYAESSKFRRVVGALRTT
jgi:hypothetical protein